MGSSAFDSLTKLRKERQEAAVLEPDAAQMADSASTEPTSSGKRGRPAGKRSSGNHVQVTAYIQRETHKATKLALLQASDERDFSELVDDLLQAWLNQHQNGEKI